MQPAEISPADIERIQREAAREFRRRGGDPRTGYLPDAPPAQEPQKAMLSSYGGISAGPCAECHQPATHLSYVAATQVSAPLCLAHSQAFAAKYGIMLPPVIAPLPADTPEPAAEVRQVPMGSRWRHGLLGRWRRGG